MVRIHPPQLASDIDFWSLPRDLRRFLYDGRYDLLVGTMVSTGIGSSGRKTLHNRSPSRPLRDLTRRVFCYRQPGELGQDDRFGWGM